MATKKTITPAKGVKAKTKKDCTAQAYRTGEERPLSGTL